MADILEDGLDAYMQATYSSNGPGAALLVAKADKVLYERCLGLADIEAGTKVTNATNFRLASVSKQFTAMGLHLLKQEGKLNYSALLTDYFPQLSKVASRVTIHHLLTHTSGLPDYENYINDDRQAQITDREVLEIVAANPNAYFKPGEKFYYSNTGYVLLALIVEQVSGMLYAEFLKERIFEPLGMHHTLLYETGKPIPNRAMGYAYTDNKSIQFSDQSICSATKGDGCIYTSLQDYLKWHVALGSTGKYSLGKTLLSHHANIEHHTNWHYSMGWFYANRSDSKYELYHTGNTCGFSNLVIRIPETELLIACFTNIADNTGLLTGLLDILQQYPETYLQSKLVRNLTQLTR